MIVKNTDRPHGNSGQVPAPAAAEPIPPREHPAWEEIELGRFQPRRIRGSLLGRELG